MDALCPKTRYPCSTFRKKNWDLGCTIFPNPLYYHDSLIFVNMVCFPNWTELEVNILTKSKSDQVDIISLLGPSRFSVMTHNFGLTLVLCHTHPRSMPRTPLLIEEKIFLLYRKKENVEKKP